MNWEKGRQPATEGLRKLLIAKSDYWDCYVIKIPANTVIDWHTDPIERGEHHRINFTLSGEWDVLLSDGMLQQKRGDSHKFRPDIERHAAYIKSDVIVLSVGWIVDFKNARTIALANQEPVTYEQVLENQRTMKEL